MSESERQFLYVATIGNKSGNPHLIEIWFVEHDGAYYIVAEHRERTHWVKNVQANPAVSFHVNGKGYRGTARIVDATTEPDLTAAVNEKMDAKYNWSAGLIVELKAGKHPT